jgi:hypothetical protein
MNNLFKYDELAKEIKIDDAGLLFTKEFETLFTRDKTDSYKERAFREFKYIFLMLDWRSPYADYNEHDRHASAREDSALTEEEWQDLDFRAACRKYKELQESALEWRLLQSAKKVVNEFIIYFNSVDPSERDLVTGKPIFKVKDIMTEVSGLSKVMEEIKTLEYQYKKQSEAPKANRAGIEEGFDPRKVRKQS